MISQVAQVWRVLPRPLRRRALGVLVLAVIAGLLEMMSLGLVIPVVSLVMGDGDVPGVLRTLGRAAERLFGLQVHQLLALGMAALLLAFSLKALVMALVSQRQAKLSFDAYEWLSSRLFSGYLARPWVFHLQRNSAQLLRNLTGEVQQVTLGLMALQVWIADALVLLAIAGLLAWVEPLGSVLALVLVGGAAWLYHHVMQDRLRHWGEVRQGFEGGRIRSAQQALAAAKEIRVLGCERHFSAEFDQQTAQAAKAGQRRTFAQQLPRVVMEWVGVVGLVLLVLVLNLQQRPASEIVATTALFSVSAFRLIPILSRMLHGVQTLQFGRAAVEAVAADLDSEPPPPRDPSAFPPLSEGIRFERVSCRHQHAERLALDDVSLFIPARSVVGIIGDTGAGKSTLVDVLLGLLEPSSGRVLVDGQDLSGRERGWQRRLGYVPQHIALIDDSIRRNVAFGQADVDVDQAALRRAVDAAQLGAFVDQLATGLDTIIGERGVKLSGGERQRIGLARALYRDPDVLMLDEATSALDIGTEARVMDAILALRGNKTVVLVAHRLSTVARCDVVVRLDAGALVSSGSPAELLA